MIDYSGELGKEFVEGQMISVDQLAKITGITIPRGRAYFELSPNKRSTSSIGDARFTEMVNRKMSITGYINGSPVVINYYSSRTGKKGEYKYHDNRITLFRKQTTRMINLEDPKGRELYILMCLHPHCEQSPFRDKNRLPVWTEVDHTARAKKAASDIEAKHAAQTAIFATSNPLLIAKGIQVNNRMLSVSNPDTAKLELIKLLDEVGVTAFTKAWDDPITMIRGVVNLSMETGVISVQQRNGMTLVKYGDLEVFELAPAKDLNIELINFFRKNTDLYEEVLAKVTK